jgi:hypothetical protein
MVGDRRGGGLNCPPLFLFLFSPRLAIRQAFPSHHPSTLSVIGKKERRVVPSNLGHDWYDSGMNELPPHRSFSQLSTWQSCPQKYYLSKVAMVPEKPAVYLAAGSAVHSMLEWLNHELYRQQSTGD